MKKSKELERQKLLKSIDTKYNFPLKTSAKIEPLVGKYLRTEQRACSSIAKTNNPNVLSKIDAWNRYDNHFDNSVLFGFNRGGTVITGHNELGKVEEERNTIFNGYSDENLCFTQTFIDNIDKKVSLSIHEVCHIGEDKDNTLGTNSLTNETRKFTFTTDYSRDCYTHMHLIKKNFKVNGMSVFDYLTHKGVICAETKRYKPWVYSVWKSMLDSNCPISLECFGSFIDDLSEYYLDIELNGITSQEYLMRRIEGYLCGLTTHNSISLASTNDAIRHKAITVKVWNFITDDWWNLRNTNTGLLQTFNSPNACIINYAANDYEYNETMSFLMNMVENLGYTYELATTLALINLFKERQKNGTFNLQLKSFIEQKLGLTQVQIATLDDELVHNIDLMGLSLFVLPKYKQYYYLDFEDLLNHRPEVTLSIMQKNIINLLNGKTLECICNPRKTILAQVS